MVSACGIHIDQTRYSLVAVEGSAKKHKITGYASGHIPADADPRTFVAGELKRIAKEQKLSSENVALAVDSGFASFRTLTLPFDDRAKVEEVIKFEVEGDLPQWDIEDVIVDFIVTSSTPGVSSDLLVTAIPKERLATQIAMCEQAGLEPSNAELEGTALFNAADAAGLFDEESAQILVHIGCATTAVVVVDGGKLVAMRAIHVGGAPHDEASELGEDGAESAPASDEADVKARLERSGERLRRELARTITGARTNNEIEAIYVFGGELPGFDGDRVADLPVERPDILPGAEEIEESADLLVAYGAALHQLGGGSVTGQLRREELRYAGRFERLELPLAVFSVLLVVLLFVMGFATHQKLLILDEGQTGQNEGAIQFWLRASNLWMLPDADTGYPGRLKNPPEAILQYAKKAERGDDPDRTKFEELREIRRRLMLEIDRLEKDLGITKSTVTSGEIPMPQSALRALTLVFATIEELGSDMGRFGIRKIKADSQTSRNGQEQYVTIKLDIDFFSENELDATRHYSNFRNSLDAKPWCRTVARKATESFNGGIGADGFTLEIETSAIPEESAQTEENEEESA